MLGSRRVVVHRDECEILRMWPLQIFYPGLLTLMMETASLFVNTATRFFWFAERLMRGPLHARPRYTHCCKGGLVRLPFPLFPPPAFKILFENPDFMENIRAYNNMFSMTSFGARVDDAVNDGRGPYVFKVSGQVSHWIGSLCPPVAEGPRFLQLYIYDTVNEVSNRLRFFESSQHRLLSPTVVESISSTLNSCNEYARLFRSAADLCAESTPSDFSIRLYSNVGDRRYEPPASGTLGGIVYAEDSNASDYDVVVRKKDGPPHRVSKLHPSYIPLQYPLLFPYGEPGWSTDLRLHSFSEGRKRNLTVNMYYSFQIHDREGMYCLLLNGGRLFQQYLVDAYTCIEQSRLDFVSKNQNLFRSEYVAGLYDALARGDNNAQDIGKRVFLPSSFTGGPDICISIIRMLLRFANGGMQVENRPDIIARVFRIKVQQFLRFMRTNRTFGEVCAELYTIEFQKRGLPHYHTLLWVTTPYKIRGAADIDQYISAEIPDPFADPELHKIVTDFMIHGPCGLARPSSPCMRDNKCSKSFPKAFELDSRFDKDGYVHYRRRDSPHRATKNGVQLDNRFVVPYNEHLCRHFNAHINVEHCGWNMLIKYLFKYISKGADRVRFCITKPDGAGPADSDATPSVVNEIQNYVDGRYICPHEASWRILNFPIHERDPAVEVLAVHLENMQNVTLKENLSLQAIVRNPSFGKTTLTEWIARNKHDADGLDLTYVTYSSRYRWDKQAVAWIPRVRLQNPAIGRLVYVHPASGLLGADKEWLTAFIESSSWATSSELRVLFVHMLLFCEVSQPLHFWETQWKSMGDDIRLRLLSNISTSDCFLNDTEVQQAILFELEKLLNSATPSKSLVDFGLPLPSASILASIASGIASLLLPSGRTAHSRFKIPIDLTDQSTCHIKKGTQLADLLKQTLLIIWDEAPMSDRRCFECLDKTLRDITKNADCPFGGKTILLGGDFRQTLPVKVKCTRSDIIDSTIPRSNLWKHFRIFKLRNNMRLRSHGSYSEAAENVSEFASWLLSIGDGLLGEPDLKDPQNTRQIKIPPQYLIQVTENRLLALISFIYDDFTINNPSPETLSTRAIVSPTNETTGDINKLVLSLTPGDCKVYNSLDVMIPHGGTQADTESLYPLEYLNLLNFPGIPPHELTLKINAPVILIRNINQTLGLCNGTRLMVSQLLPRIIEAQIITGIKLYVALSRATSPGSLKILIDATDENSSDTTNNVVFADFIDEVNMN
ncbi:hypothetical protein CASFOL_014350 [Castilleja foliolosa]|uniref:ATP-dependent DNA helicase n=1 Tax=Castilleja foliolosa TaxID=1961234 RepID=A0ABD3DMP5_9LAMI